MKLEKNVYGVQSDEKKEEVAISKLFRVFREKMLKLVTSTDYTDGIEVVAMLVTVHMMLSHRLPPPIPSEVEMESLAQWQISTDDFEPEWDFMEEVLLECKTILTARLDEFVSSQLAWFREKKIDPKKTGVFSPISRFPAFMDQLMVFTGSKVSCIIWTIV
mgnify:FL=1